MPAIFGKAPGKVILFGEHAVVYNRPAIAVPINDVNAKVTVVANPRLSPGQVNVYAPDIGLEATVGNLPENDPIAKAIQLTKEATKIKMIPACNLRITSTIPVASGLGSGAAVTVAIMRALSDFIGEPLSDSQISALTYEVEKIHHGTPSGIDNTVITFNKPVYFVKGQPVVLLKLKSTFTLVIGDTGDRSPTKVAVGDVRKAWERMPQRYESFFDQIGAIAKNAREALETGEWVRLGKLMDANHTLLQKLNVSSAKLDRLVAVARDAGALGAKLSGGGRGGNMIALVPQEAAKSVAESLREEGAAHTLVTQVGERI